jgi:peptide/nickel transport system ATP-binding protein/oligopeptide transport system ATP-binding protein
VNAPAILLEVEDLRTSFGAPGRRVPAVRGVSFSIREGEALGLIGESGSGKTVTGLSLLRLLPETAHMETHKLAYRGQDIAGLSPEAFRAMRGVDLAMIFQDPVGSFNPAKRIGWHLEQAILRRGDAEDWQAEAGAILADVGIRQPERVLNSYPHQLSGGMLQRALIAMIIALRPSLIIADEPTTNLDNLVERQILELIRTHQKKIGASVLFITHDLAIAGEICDRIAVMYAGQIIEIGPTREVLERPKHPYAEGLLATSASLDRGDAELHELPGEPGGLAPAEGCAFAPRCVHASAVCTSRMPGLYPVGPDHFARCLLHEGGSP